MNIESHVETEAARSLDKFADGVECGCRLERCSLTVLVAEDAEDRAQFVERLVARLLDRLERSARVTWILMEKVRGHAGLDVDRRQRMGDGVVKVPRDP